VTSQSLVFILILILFIALVAYLIRRDALSRGISDLTALIFTLLIIFAFPVGLLVYIAYVLGKNSQTS